MLQCKANLSAWCWRGRRRSGTALGFLTLQRGTCFCFFLSLFSMCTLSIWGSVNVVGKIRNIRDLAIMNRCFFSSWQRSSAHVYPGLTAVVSWASYCLPAWVFLCLRAFLGTLSRFTWDREELIILVALDQCLTRAGFSNPQLTYHLGRESLRLLLTASRSILQRVLTGSSVSHRKCSRGSVCFILCLSFCACFFVVGGLFVFLFV